MRRASARVRVVDRFVVHGEPVDFRQLALRAIPEDTKFLVLDLDRTIHLARNMGELLGWEICAWHGYGERRLAELDATRAPTRFLFDVSRPRDLARYVANGTRMWIWPGTYYFLFGKLAPHLGPLRRAVYRTFGPDPVRTVQRVPQTALMHHMSELPLATVRTLAARLFERYAGDQIVERQDLEWLRARCPDLRVIVSSASPRPVVEAAADVLGADEIVCTEIDEHEGSLAAPWRIDARFMQRTAPHRIAPPSRVRINAGVAKIDELLRRHPDIADPDVVTVGITDNGYGEDRCWAEHFTHVIDVNTDTPFSPIVGAVSPVREIHSAAVLTLHERHVRAGGDERYFDPRRREPNALSTREWDGDELQSVLERRLLQIDSLSAIAETARDLTADALASIETRAADQIVAIEAMVERYNAVGVDGRETLLRELREAVRASDRIEDERARCLAEVSAASCRIAEATELARDELDAIAPVPEGTALPASAHAAF